MIGMEILGTASVLPGRARTTAEVGAEAMPDRPADVLEARTGIRARHWIDGETSAVDLGVDVLSRALDRAGIEAEALRRVIFVTSTGGDALIPANANAVCAGLGLAGTCDAFDVNNACCGFLTGMDLAARSVATGLAPVAVVVVETLSRFLRPEEPRPYVVLADAAAAAVLGPARDGSGVLGAAFGNDGTHRGRVTLAHPGVTGAEALIQFGASNKELAQAAPASLAEIAAEALGQAGARMEDVEWVLPHQPNGSMLDRIVETLGLREDRVVRVVDEIGSVGAASIAVSLDRLLRQRPVRPGDRILLVGVGAGVSYGAILYQSAGTGSGTIATETIG